MIVDTDHRFCEECGAALEPGARFCGDCGSSTDAPDSAPPPGPVLPVGPPPAEHPVAVVPFAHTKAGLFSIAECTLVVYPGRVVVAYVPKSRAGEMDRARTDIESVILQRQVQGQTFWDLVAGAGAGLVKLSWSAPDFSADDAARERSIVGTVGIPVRPWEVYWSMPADEVLAEDSRNRAIPREEIAYVRGESDPDSSTEQILIRSPDGLLTLYFELGTFSEARKALLSFLAPASGGPESVLGVIPWGSEPQVNGFGFQYVWNLIVTDRRLVLCMCEDEFVDETEEWLRAKENEAKTAERDWRDLDEIGRPDSPWQRLAGTPIHGLLANDVNFFIPLRAVGAVEVVPGARRHGDEVRFTLPGEVVTLSFPQGTAELARGVLERALPGRVR